VSDPLTDWDGTWLALLETIPAARRQARRPLYAGLTWAGFGNPVSGLWLSPHVERREEVRRLIDEVDLSAHTLAVVGAVDAIGVDESTIVRQGWDLDRLAALRADAEGDGGPRARSW
jgi:phenylacetic acid degradation operon negative regulatory protein